MAAARVGEAGGKRRRLAEVAAEADHPQPGVPRLQRRQLRERIVRAAIVNDDEFVAAAVVLERPGQLVVERREVGRLVVDGDDDRKLGSHQVKGYQGII
jgi:hypothetical protein